MIGLNTSHFTDEETEVQKLLVCFIMFSWKVRIEVQIFMI